MKKLFVFLFIGLFLVNFASADFDFDNVLQKERQNGDKYETLTIRNSLLGIPTTKVAELKIEDDGAGCMIDCEAIIDINLYSPQVLFTELTFKDNRNKDKVKDFKVFYEKEDCNDVQVKDTYETVCGMKDGYEQCYDSKVTYKTVEICTNDWKKYKGEEMRAGNYSIKIEAKKDPAEKIDWSFAMLGITSDQIRESWAWWNSTWDNKKAVNLAITGSNTNDDFQAHIRVDYTANMNADFSDLRFTDAAETTELSYYIDAKVDSSYANVWVRLNTNVTTSNSTLAYMYYGNSGASNNSNIATTFYLYDDFVTANSTKWNAVSGSLAVTGENADLNSDMWVSYENWSYDGVVYEMQMNGSLADASAMQNPNSNGGVDTSDLTFLGYNCGGRYFKTVNDASTTGTSCPSGSVAADALIATVRPNSSILEMYVNGALDESFNTNVPDDNINLGMRDWGGNGILVEWARVRGWNDTIVESSFGAEEANVAAPEITLIAPENAYISSNQTVTFSANVTDDLEVSEVTLFIDGAVNQTNTSGVNGTYTWIMGIEDGDYTWAVGAVDNESGVDNSSTRTFTIDSLLPSVNVTAPSGTYDILYEAGSLTLNWNVSDPHLNNCSYEYNSVSTNVTCGDNTTSINYTSGINNLTFYATDTASNTESNMTSWNVNLIVETLSNVTSTTELKVEDYVANLSYNSTGFLVITAELNLDGLTFTGTKTGSGDDANFMAEVEMPTVNVSTNFTTYWTVSLTNATATYDFNLTSSNVTVEPINFSLCSAGNNVAFWNFTVYNETSLLPVASDFEATFVLSSAGSTGVKTINYSDTTTSTSSFDFCISPAAGDYLVDTNIQISAPDFVTRYYNFEDINLTNTTREDDLYLLSTAESTSYIIHVVDVSATNVENAEVRVQRYYPGLAQWLTTEIVTTNYVGESIGHIVSEDANYRFLVYQAGISVYNSTSTQIICSVDPCTVTLVIPISFSTGIEGIDGFTSSLTYSTTTNLFTYTYTDTSSDFDSARLEVYRIFPANASVYTACNESKSTATGVVTCDLTLETNGTYRAEGYLTRDGVEVLAQRIEGVKGNNIYNTVGLDGVLWSIFIFIGIAMLGMARPSLAIIFGVIGFITLALIGLINLGAISIVAVTAIGIILLMRIGRE